MRVALVSSYTRAVALGLRYISACLKLAGHEVNMYFLSSRHDTAQPDYCDRLLEDFVDRVRSADVIGVSLMTNSFRRARALTARIRSAGVAAPIVWGGVHPTLAPGECLEHADAVCIGEGEHPFLELIERLEQGHDPTDVRSMWFRAGGTFGNAGQVQNPIAPLEEHLDALPFPDYDLAAHFVAAKDRLVPAEPANLGTVLHKFTLISSRGCPFECSFCNNTALRDAHQGAGKWVRLRSLERVLDELRMARACFPSISQVQIVDDLFFVHDAEQIERFIDAYNQDIGLPLLVQVSPTTVNERKVQALARAPLFGVIMGIQSACDDTLRTIFNRTTPLARVARAIDILAQHKLPMEFDYIVNNPFEPPENVIATMRFAATHHRPPFRVHTYPLMFFPGTQLFDRARAEDMISARHDIAYDHDARRADTRPRADYLSVCLCIVLAMRSWDVPRSLVHGFISLATNRPARWLLQREPVGAVALMAYWLGRKLFRNVLYQVFIKPFTYLRRESLGGTTTADACAAPTRRWTISTPADVSIAAADLDGKRAIE